MFNSHKQVRKKEIFIENIYLMNSILLTSKTVCQKIDKLPHYIHYFVKGNNEQTNKKVNKFRSCYTQCKWLLSSDELFRSAKNKTKATRTQTTTINFFIFCVTIAIGTYTHTHTMNIKKKKRWIKSEICYSGRCVYGIYLFLYFYLPIAILIADCRNSLLYTPQPQFKHISNYENYSLHNVHSVNVCLRIHSLAVKCLKKLFFFVLPFFRM